MRENLLIVIVLRFSSDLQIAEDTSQQISKIADENAFQDVSLVRT